jgi:hypothetical protein
LPPFHFWWLKPGIKIFFFQFFGFKSLEKKFQKVCNFFFFKFTLIYLPQKHSKSFTTTMRKFSLKRKICSETLQNQYFFNVLIFIFFSMKFWQQKQGHLEGTFDLWTLLYELKQGVCRTVALAFTFKSTLRQKKNYGNSNISLCKNIMFKKTSKRNQNPSRYYNSIITNLKFQHKPKYHLSKILI